MHRGTNLPAVGGYNQALILDVIRRSGEGASRVELAEKTGLSAQTLSNVSRRLLDEGLIREGGKTVSGPGKPRTILRLEPEARFAVGVHLDPTVITYVVLDLEGHVVAHSRTRTPVGTKPEETIRRLTASVTAIVETSGVDATRILGIGIAAPGPLDAEGGQVFNPPRMTEWHNVPLGASLSASTGLPVFVEKDVTAAVAAERWMGALGDLENSLFFYYGTGLGAGLVVDGTVVRGASSNSGDIGHLIVDPDGPLCRCGKRGCLGDSVAPVSLVIEAIEAGLVTAPTGPLDSVTVDNGFTRLLGLTDEGNDRAAVIVGRAARRIARGVLAIVSILDVDRVVFGGPFWDRASRAFLDIVPGAVSDDPALMMTHPIRFEESKLGADVAAIGAGCLVLDRVLSPKPTDLLIEPRVSDRA
ncbi:ROK family protein [Agreia sp.]|uniref:ROK family transcriptional regulator n=1 Tax=Agreia sp. TaxID=1872416 RepID=UPI0035BBAC02